MFLTRLHPCYFFISSQSISFFIHSITHSPSSPYPPSLLFSLSFCYLCSSIIKSFLNHLTHYSLPLSVSLSFLIYYHSSFYLFSSYALSLSITLYLLFSLSLSLIICFLFSFLSLFLSLSLFTQQIWQSMIPKSD